MREIQDVDTRSTSGWEARQEGEDVFWVDTPFKRAIIDASNEKSGYAMGDIELRGYGSTWVEDRDGEYVAPDAFDKDLPEYLAKNPIMLWQHNPANPVGKVRDALVDDNGLDVVGWQPLPNDKEPDWKHLAYHSVKSGIVKTFSIGGYFDRKQVRSKMVIKRVRLMELSVVSIPANPDSIFEAAVKSLNGGGLRPTLTSKHVAQMSQILGASEMTDPELLLMNETQRIARYEELSTYYTRCGKRAPSYDEWNELAKETLSSKGLAAVRGNGLQVVQFMRKLQGVAPATDEDLKRGRRLNVKNEEMLRQARDLINEVVASVDSQEEA